MDDASRQQAIEIAMRRFEGRKTAYDSEYLDAATDSLGLMCDAGISIYKHELPLWFGMFAFSFYGKRFSEGYEAYFGSMEFSGEGLAFHLQELYCGYAYPPPSSRIWQTPKPYESMEFNFGVCACLLQWGLNVSFPKMIEILPTLELYNLVREFPENDFEALFNECLIRWEKRIAKPYCPNWTAILRRHCELNDRDKE